MAPEIAKSLARLLGQAVADFESKNRKLELPEVALVEEAKAHAPAEPAEGT